MVNSMRGLLTKETFYLKRYFGLLILAFVAFPLIQGLVMGLIYAPYLGEQGDLSEASLILYSDASEYDTEDMFKELETTKQTPYAIEIADTFQAMQEGVRQNDKSLGLYFDGQRFSLAYHGSMSHERRLLIETLRPVLKSANLSLEAGEPATLIDSSTNGIGIDTQLVATESLPLITNMFVNTITGIGLMLSIYFANRYFKDRKRDVNNRLVAFGVESSEYLWVQWLTVFFVSLLLLTIYSVIAFVIMSSVKLNILGLILTNILFAGLIAGLYACFISVFQSERRYMAWSFPLLGVMMFFGGSFFPLDKVKNVIAIAYLMPNFHLQEIYKNMLLNKTLTDVLPSLLVVALMVTVLTTLARKTFRLGDIR